MSTDRERQDVAIAKNRLARLVAAVLGFALAVLGAISLPAAAVAASGTINSLELVTVYDGAQVPNEFDAGAENGVVASNDVVGFRWNLNATDLGDGVFTQTLPEGWAWDESSLASLDSSSSVYQAGYTLSGDGRTLTATISTGNGTGNPSVLSFGVLVAIPSGDVPNGSVYEPAVTAVVGEDARTAATDPIEVRNAPRAELTKTRGGNNILSTFDFGDGAGAVPARYIDFPVSITDAVGKIGAHNIELRQPVVVDDAFTLQAPEGYEDARFVAQIVSISEEGATVELAQSGNAATLTFDGFASMPSATATVRLWVRESEVPVDSLGAIRLVNTVTPRDWTDTDGEAVGEDADGNTAEGTVLKPPPFGAIARSKNIYLFDDQEGDFSIPADPSRSGQPYTNVSGAEISLGSTVASRFVVRPAVDSTTNTTTAADDLIAYDFWDPAEQRIVEGADIYVGNSTGSASLAAGDYTIQYTAGGDSENPEDNSWVASVAEAGGTTAVSGIRVAYTAGAWGDGTPAATSSFTVAVPFTIVAPLGTSATDHASWTFTDGEGTPRESAVTQFVNVGSYRLLLDKAADRSSIVSGSDVTYTLTPAVERALGAIEDVDVRDLRIVDTLPAGLVSVDTSEVAAPWQVTRSGSAESGLVLTFAYDGVVRTGDELPSISYVVTTSVLAPADSRLVNTATIDALGTTQPVSARTDATTTTVFQAQVVTEEKVVVGEEQIEVGDPQASWETRWYNFQSSSQGESYFVDVLPYDGDARGTGFSGTAKLATAIVTDGAGAPAAEGYATLQYTTDPASDVYAAEANDASIDWADADGVDLAEIDGVTALRVIVHDFASGEPGLGGLLVTLDVEGQRDGDRYVNTTNGWLGVNGLLGMSNPAEITVVDSSIAGIVWEDLNADGVRDEGEPLIGGATVRLLDAAGEEVAVVETGADGGYLFPALHSGEYRTVVDVSGLGFPANHVVSNTYDLDGDLDSDSGAIQLAKAEDRIAVDFGYATRVSEIDLEKSGRLAGDARAGEWVDWEFTITNTGENPLTSVELVDHLDGVVDLQVQWPGEEGVLEAGDSAPATARYQLTQEDLDRGFVHNTATASGLDPNGTVVEDPADATVTLPEGGSLLLEKEGALLGDAAAGGEVRWSFTLTNTGNVTLSGLQIHDELEGLGEIVWQEWPGEAFALAPGESVTASAGYALTQDDVDAGCVVNVADADGRTPALAAAPSNEDDAQVCFTPASSIALVKLTNGVEYEEAPGAQLAVGDAVEWSYIVTNTGDTTLRNVQLVDDPEGRIAPPEGFDGTLAPGESVTFTAQDVAIEGGYHNVAVVTGTTPSGGPVTDEDESWYTAEERPSLAITGGQAAWLLAPLAAGALLIAVGIAIMRRRRGA
ncbi:DUF7507 domain-containing protein [Microbacterium tumbae]